MASAIFKRGKFRVGPHLFAVKESDRMEITLFNKNGKPTAYIADDGETIYLWDGRPVAFVSEDKVFDWNGRQLGWFNNGTIFDIYGLRSGFIKSKSPIATEMEPLKPQKHLKPAKGERQSHVLKPVLCYGYSSKNLEDLLEPGGNDDRFLIQATVPVMPCRPQSGHQRRQPGPAAAGMAGGPIPPRSTFDWGSRSAPDCRAVFPSNISRFAMASESRDLRVNLRLPKE